MHPHTEFAHCLSGISGPLLSRLASERQLNGLMIILISLSSMRHLNFLFSGNKIIRQLATLIERYQQSTVLLLLGQINYTLLTRIKQCSSRELSARNIYIQKRGAVRGDSLGLPQLA